MSHTKYCVLTTGSDLLDEIEETGILPPWGDKPVIQYACVNNTGEWTTFNPNLRWDLSELEKVSKDERWQLAVVLAENLDKIHISNVAMELIAKTYYLDLTEEDEQFDKEGIYDANDSLIRKDVTIQSLSKYLLKLLKQVLLKGNTAFRELVWPIQTLAQLQDMTGPFTTEVNDSAPLPCFAIEGAAIENKEVTIHFVLTYD
jgi:hypothetical protein